ncbi:AAT-domain-containing protein [Marasmius fiardii PR-910]|nr:AAT-domain-containing protein [Marasmius fiardii PR-910]
MPLQPPPQIELRGTPHEVGTQHGKRLLRQIRGQIQVYEAMFQRTSNLTWAAVRDISKEYRETILRLTPDIYAEMEGIAEGAGLDILDIVALNTRSEIALGLFSDGCTSLGWKLPATGEVFLAQNWDWTPRVQENLAMVSIEQPGLPKIHMVTEAGIVGKIGFNSASVGVCLNAIRAHPTDAKKLPIHVALRLCLQSTSIQGAIHRLESLGGISSSQHILIADPTGSMGLELSPLGNAYLSPNEHGLVAHTNHFLSNRPVGLQEPLWEHIGTIERLDRINELLDDWVKDRKRPVLPETLRQRLFSDTSNAPVSICAQGSPDRPIEVRSQTLFCIIMMLGREGKTPSAEVMWGRPGNEEETGNSVLRMPWSTY